MLQFGEGVEGDWRQLSGRAGPPILTRNEERRGQDKRREKKGGRGGMKMRTAGNGEGGLL